MGTPHAARHGAPPGRREARPHGRGAEEARPARDDAAAPGAARAVRGREHRRRRDPHEALARGGRHRRSACCPARSPPRCSATRSRPRSAARARSTGGSSAARSRCSPAAPGRSSAGSPAWAAGCQRMAKPGSSLANWRALDAQLGPECLRIASYNVHSCRGTDGSKDAARIAGVIEELGCDTVGAAGSRLPPRLHRAEARHAGDSRPHARAPRRPVRQRAAHAPQGARRAPPGVHLLAARAAQRARRRPRGRTARRCA